MPKVPSWIKVLFRHRRESLEEFIYLVIFALMPVWLSTIIQFVFSRKVFSYLESYLYSGDALLISAATIGPLIYLIFKDYHKNQDGFSRSFPGRGLFAPVIIVVCLVSAAILGINNAGQSTESMSASALWYISLVVAVVSTLVWFGVITIKNSLEYAAPEMMRQDTTDFVTEWNK